jgi:hypothetical protein
LHHRTWQHDSERPEWLLALLTRFNTSRDVKKKANADHGNSFDVTSSARRSAREKRGPWKRQSWSDRRRSFARFVIEREVFAALRILTAAGVDLELTFFDNLLSPRSEGRVRLPVEPASYTM